MLLIISMTIFARAHVECVLGRAQYLDLCQSQSAVATNSTTLAATPLALDAGASGAQPLLQLRRSSYCYGDKAAPSLQVCERDRECLRV